MIGEKVQRLRLQRGLTLSDLAERAGIAKSYLSAIERSIQVNPSIQVLEKLAAILGVTVQTLIQSDGESDAVTALDQDWIQLVREAMWSGIDKEQFREYLEFQKWRQTRGD